MKLQFYNLQFYFFFNATVILNNVTNENTNCYINL